MSSHTLVYIARSSCCPSIFTSVYFFFFLNDRAPPEISPLPLHAALPICRRRQDRRRYKLPATPQFPSLPSPQSSRSPASGHSPSSTWPAVPVRRDPRRACPPC